MTVLTTMLTPLGRALRNKRAGLAHSVRRAPQLSAPRTLTVTSPAFVDGGVIPDRHCSMDLGPNVSPALAFSGVPAGARQLLLVIEDIDVPKSTPGLHTVALFAPTVAGFAEGTLTTTNAQVRFVPTLMGRTGYYGPRPFPGHGTHHYGFHLYALDIELTQPARTLAALLPLLDGHVLADGLLEGVKTG